MAFAGLGTTVQPFLTKIRGGRSTPLGLETETDRQHLESVTVIRGNHVIQINEQGIEETEGPLAVRDAATVVCLTFDTEDGRRFFRTYEYRLGKVTVNTSDPGSLAPWEDDPELGITPSRLKTG